jgi:hypothetical protein
MRSRSTFCIEFIIFNYIAVNKNTHGFLLLQLCGRIGALGLLTAFYLNSSNKLSASNKNYQLINLLSAMLLTINAFYINSYPFIIINIFWAGVALMSLMRSNKA